MKRIAMLVLVVMVIGQASQPVWADTGAFLDSGYPVYLTDGRIAHVYTLYFWWSEGEFAAAWGMHVETDCTWEVFQDHQFGGDLPPNPAYFGIDPDLQFDTFVTGPCWDNPECEHGPQVGYSSETPTTYDVQWMDMAPTSEGEAIIAQITIVTDDPTITPSFNGELIWASVQNPQLQTYVFGNWFYDCNNNCRDDAEEMAECDGEAWCSDCNNGVLDICDVKSGYSNDDNDNGIPDECEDYWADIDGDGDVDLQDLAILLAHYGMQSSDIGHAQGDLDGDHDVDLQDLAILLAEYGSGT